MIIFSGFIATAQKRPPRQLRSVKSKRYLHLVNVILGGVPDIAGSAITLERMLAYLMDPIVWLMSIPWNEAVTAGSLMGLPGDTIEAKHAYGNLLDMKPDFPKKAREHVESYAMDKNLVDKLLKGLAVSQQAM